MIGIVDYGTGNLSSILKSFEKMGADAKIVSSQNEIELADKLILPGVGHFSSGMEKLNDRDLVNILHDKVLLNNTPILGICLGMQLFANYSHEGNVKGLGWIDAEVKQFDGSAFTQPTHLPHMGWNDVVPTTSHPILNGLEINARFYFLHSYYFSEADSKDVLTKTEYNGLYTSSVCRNNIFGVQFHPEKSHHWGERLLKNFAEITVC